MSGHKCHDNIVMQTRNCREYMYCLYTGKKQNVNKIYIFLPFEKCAGHQQYFIKFNNFIPFCRPSYGKVRMQAMIEFVNSNSIIPE